MVARVLRLPDQGRLLVSTDLQGNLPDYERMENLFLTALVETDGRAHLLFTGDLIHGPHIAREEWPDFLGEYYQDASGEVVDRFEALQQRFPGQVHAILGNHEHAHIGGPHTAKFAADEVIALEEQLGPQRSERLRAFLRTLPLVALAPCGIVFSHGAPAADLRTPDDLERVSLEGYEGDSPLDIFDEPIIGPLLWARSAPPSAARHFLRAMGGRVSVYGHDVIPEGYERIGDEQMIVSTSFGLANAYKVYLDLELGGRYRTVHDLRDGHEILPLYPDAATAARVRSIRKRGRSHA